MKCDNCGMELQNGAAFCGNCGCRVMAYETKTHQIPSCKYCGALLEDGATVCGTCGSPVESSASEDYINGGDSSGNSSTGVYSDYISDDYSSGGGSGEGATEYASDAYERAQYRSSGAPSGGYYGGMSWDTNENLTYCGHCGAKIPADAKVCTNCGKRQGANPGGKYKVIILVLALAVLAMTAAISAYLIYNKSSGDENGDNDSVSVTTQPVEETAMLTPAAAQPTTNAAVAVTEAANAQSAPDTSKLTTYYVVNCSSSISLRSAPSTAATALKEIPLGSPVSYVENAENGFAKVIYNGTTGYALQSYLSANANDVTVRVDEPARNAPAEPNRQAPPASNNGSSSSGGSSSTTTGTVVTNPSYKTYSDSEFNFSCAYPSHFVVYNESENFVRYSLKAPDNTARLKICATANDNGRSVAKVLENFKVSYPGTIDYQDSGADWCAARTIQNGQCHYCYFKVTSSSIRGFEMHYDQTYYSIYDGYVNSIYNSLNFY